MATDVLSGPQDYASFFRRGILINIQYWLDHVTNNATDVAALDRERERIVRAIAFALDVTEAWPLSCELIITFSSYMERRGYWETWSQLLERAVTIARQIKDMNSAITLSALLGRLLQRQSYLVQAIIQYRRVIRLARQVGYEFEVARACTNLAYLYIEHGHWWRAELLCCHALVIFERLNSDHGRAHTENHLGILYTRQGLWNEAGQHLERACAIWQAREDHHGLMYGLMNLGMLYVETDQPAEALACSVKALEQAELTGEELEIGKIYMNMGMAYRLQGDLSQAESYNRQAETIFRRFFNVEGIADSLENLGLIYLEQQHYAEALEHLESALTNWRALNNKHDEIKTMLYLAQAELAQGNHQGAAVWFKEAESELGRYPQIGRYYQLPAQVEQLRHSLAEVAVCQAVVG